jgi:4-aminobutyrate aminotransferase/4-aminobutyrate aminotransferase/(S)-3-amino-2-methylpropionate transaminase
MGLMQGAELVKEGKEPADQEVDRILEIMKNKGIIIGKNGRFRNVLAFQPPLVIEQDNVDETAAALDEALTEVEPFHQVP